MSSEDWVKLLEKAKVDFKKELKKKKYDFNPDLITRAVD